MLEMLIILDRSGSMSGNQSDVIGGINQLIEKQRERLVAAPMRVSLYQFDHEYQVDYEGVSLADVTPLTYSDYIPRGSTALLDAVGRTIKTAGERYSQSDSPPDGVVCVIFTDGMENASLEFTRDQIKSMIEHQRDVYDWEFIFMGADIDAYASANLIGVMASQTVNASKSELRMGFTHTESLVCAYTDRKSS